MKVYFDNAATTPLDPEVFEVMKPLLLNMYGNPSSTHAHGREVRSKIEYSRRKVAELLNTVPAEIFFTSGGTEADNTAIRCMVEAYNIKHIITTSTTTTTLTNQHDANVSCGVGCLRSLGNESIQQ